MIFMVYYVTIFFIFIIYIKAYLISLIVLLIDSISLPNLKLIWVSIIKPLYFIFLVFSFLLSLYFIFINFHDQVIFYEPT